MHLIRSVSGVVVLWVCLGVSGGLAGEPVFYRGDCNASHGPIGFVVDIADAAAVVNYVFRGRYDPPCLDACDCNDDGALDGTDAICIAMYLFRAGPFPPAPGPGLRPFGSGVVVSPPGLDPTADLLDCTRGVDLN